MDSLPLEMDDIFGEFDGDDDDGGFNPSRLPDLEDELEPMRDIGQDEENQEEEEITDNAELLAKLKSMKGASKNTTKRTMPKLDATRLTGERGMAILPKAFERVRLKGRNHEAEDLKIIMHTLQHWGHRLFPKMTFDEILERVERLGAKKEVQTCLKKIRLDMPVLASDMVGDEEDTVQRQGDENEAVSSQRQDGDHNHDASRLNESHNEISDEELEDLLRDQGQPVPTSNPPQISANSSSSTVREKGLSEEVRRRIEENKRKAMERRAAKTAASTIIRQNDTSACIDEIISDKGKDMSISKDSMEMETCKDPQDSHFNTVEEKETEVMPCSKRLSEDNQTGILPQETEPFQIGEDGENARQNEPIEYEVREMPSDDEDWVISENNKSLIFNAHAQEEDTEGSYKVLD